MNTNAEFGFTRWGADIVRLAEPLDIRKPNPAVPRARSLARNNCVNLTVDGRNIKGLVAAGGQASVTHLEFASFAPELVSALAEDPSHGEPDDRLHETLTTAGLSPTPVIVGADCSCKARGDRCLHILASLYALATLVDHEPTTALTVQGYTPGTAPHSGNGPTQRWTPLSAFDVRDYCRTP
ncbi:MAG: SWIM zinc finger family protein [Gordonia amarae]